MKFSFELDPEKVYRDLESQYNALILHFSEFMSNYKMHVNLCTNSLEVAFTHTERLGAPDNLKPSYVIYFDDDLDTIKDDMAKLIRELETSEEVRTFLASKKKLSTHIARFENSSLTPVKMTLDEIFEYVIETFQAQDDADGFLCK